MRGLFKRRLEKDKMDWYKCHGMKPPDFDSRRKKIPRTKADVQTYTETTVLDVFAPVTLSLNRPLSYWEGEGAGIEPTEFTTSVTALRSQPIVSRDPCAYPKPGNLQECSTPYKNDLMTFDAFETIRRELKHRSDHLASEMERVHDEWTRPPKDNWFTLKDCSFSIEHCRYMEILRRKTAREMQKIN
jgi:hypothetical protein